MKLRLTEIVFVQGMFEVTSKDITSPLLPSTWNTKLEKSYFCKRRVPFSLSLFVLPYFCMQDNFTINLKILYSLSQKFERLAYYFQNFVFYWVNCLKSNGNFQLSCFQVPTLIQWTTPSSEDELDRRTRFGDLDLVRVRLTVTVILIIILWLVQNWWLPDTDFPNFYEKKIYLCNLIILLWIYLRVGASLSSSSDESATLGRLLLGSL